ncbi:hypothetical protein [Methylomonas methanica]|nr:hypothetical protein [Methylomonas methanica]
MKSDKVELSCLEKTHRRLPAHKAEALDILRRLHAVAVGDLANRQGLA